VLLDSNIIIYSAQPEHAQLRDKQVVVQHSNTSAGHNTLHITKACAKSLLFTISLVEQGVLPPIRQQYPLRSWESLLQSLNAIFQILCHAWG
jgi:hypothetical protein